MVVQDRSNSTEVVTEASSRRFRRRRFTARRRVAGGRRAGGAAYMFLAPWLAGFVVFTAGPLLLSLYFSFTDFDLVQAPHWTGTKNYTDMLHDARYLGAVRTTLIFVALSVPLGLAAALGVALLLNRDLRGMGFYRALYYIPSLMGGSVAIAIVWRKVFGANGIIDEALSVAGIHTGGLSIVDDARTALYSLVALNVWQFGAPMVIFLAGLRQIPPEYYEAAALDGCGAVRQFFSITLPLLTPVVFFNLVLGVIGGFQTFTNAYVISGGNGGPVNATLLYALYLYQQAFRSFHMGYASALAWILLVTVALFTALLFWSQRRWVHYGDEIR